MNLAYVQGQSVEYGELKPVLMTGSGPVSYSQTTADPVANPAAGDYISFLADCNTRSGLYTLKAVPTAVAQFRAGAPSPSASGWKYVWYVLATGAQVANAVNLSAEVVQTSGVVTQL
jgi:hypothetical protein